jgi:hypothetical protein
VLHMVLKLTATVSVKSINRLGFAAETQCVFCEIVSGFVYKTVE